MLEPYIPDPHLMLEMDRMRRQELFGEAERHRLIRQARSEAPRLLDRILVGIGSFLILAGERLRARHVPLVCHTSETCCVDC